MLTRPFTRPLTRGLTRPLQGQGGVAPVVISAPDGVYPGNDLFVTGGCETLIYQLYIDGVPYGDVFTVSPTEIPFVTTGQKITVRDSCGNVSNELTAEGVDVALRLQTHRGKIIGYQDAIRVSGAGTAEVNGLYLFVAPDWFRYGSTTTRLTQHGMPPGALWYIYDNVLGGFYRSSTTGPNPAEAGSYYKDPTDVGVLPAPTVELIQLPIYEPYHVWQDTALTIPAEIDDAVAGWDWPGLPEAIQSNALSRGTLRDFNGVPAAEFPAATGMVTDVYVGGPDWAITIMEIPFDSDQPNTATVQSIENSNYFMSPSRDSNRYYIGGDTGSGSSVPGGVPVIATMGVDSGLIKVWENGIDITSSSGIPAVDFGTLAIGMSGAETAYYALTNLLAVIVHKYSDRESITSYLETLKPSTA